MNSQMTIQF